MYKRTVKCFIVITIFFIAITFVPWVNGERLFSKNHKNISSLDSGKSQLLFIFLLLIWLALFLLVAGVLIYPMLLSILPVVAYGIIYAIGTIAYLFLICAPIMFLLQTLDTLFPDSSIIDILLNITSKLLIIPVAAGGAFLILLCMPPVLFAAIIGLWFAVSLQLAINIWYILISGRLSTPNINSLYVLSLHFYA